MRKEVLDRLVSRMCALEGKTDEVSAGNMREILSLLVKHPRILFRLWIESLK